MSKVSDELKKDLGGKQENKSIIPKTLAGLDSEGIKKILDIYKPQIAQVLSGIVSTERFIQICSTLIRNSDIAKCTASSIIGAIMQCAIIRLDPTPILQECNFLPYENKKKGIYELQFGLGYKGILKLIHRTDKVASVDLKCVYDKDFWDYQEGDSPFIKHKPNLDEEGKLKYVYAIITFTNGGKQRIVMNKKAVYRLKNKSQAKDSKYSPWNKTEDEFTMWLKSALKQLNKYVPFETETQKQLAVDEVVIEPDKFDMNTKELDLNLLEPYEIQESNNENYDIHKTGEEDRPLQDPTVK